MNHSGKAYHEANNALMVTYARSPTLTMKQTSNALMRSGTNSLTGSVPTLVASSAIQAQAASLT